MFYWDNWNRPHIAKHGVDPSEAAYVVAHAGRPYPEQLGEGKLRVWGTTADGRLLQVIFVYRPVESLDLADVPPHERLELEDIDEVVYVIHARDLEPREKRRLRHSR